MSSEDKAEAWLLDILDNIERIERYTMHLDQGTLAADYMRRDAVERCLARICEAAARLGQRGPEIAPDQPWNEIRGLGNWLRHAYDRIDFGVLWATVTENLPALKADIQSAVARKSV